MRCDQSVGVCTHTHELMALSHAWMQGCTTIFQPTTARPVAHRVVIPLMPCRLRGCAGSWSSASSAMRRPWRERRLTSHLHAMLCRPELLGPCSRCATVHAVQKRVQAHRPSFVGCMLPMRRGKTSSQVLVSPNGPFRKPPAYIRKPPAYTQAAIIPPTDQASMDVTSEWHARPCTALCTSAASLVTCAQ